MAGSEAACLCELRSGIVDLDEHIPGVAIVAAAVEGDAHAVAADLVKRAGVARDREAIVGGKIDVLPIIAVLIAAPEPDSERRSIDRQEGDPGDAQSPIGILGRSAYGESERRSA